MKKYNYIMQNNQRILKELEKAFPTIEYSSLSQALRQKDIIVNGTRLKENIVVPKGSEIVFFVSDNADKKLYETVFEDNNIMVVNKQKGIEVCDGEFNLLFEIKKHQPEIYAVHRLDRNTSGLVIFAKNPQSEKSLLKAFKTNTIKKFYIAEVVGVVKQKKATLVGYLTKDEKYSKVDVSSKKVANSVKITTKYEVIKTGSATTLLEVEILGGKTHQIRAHFASIGHPIVGDGKYGQNQTNKKFGQKTQNLHAYKLVLNFAANDYLSYLNAMVIKNAPEYLNNYIK